MQKHNVLVTGIVVIFLLIFSSISLVNHFLFRTAALDLGMFNQALYCFSHLKMNYFTLDIADPPRNLTYFADHFSLITLLYSPLYYVFGTYTLLLVQIGAILLGGIAVFQYSKKHCNFSFVPYFNLIQFYCIWGVYTALAFDFHNNVIAAMLLPWLLLSWDKNNMKSFIIFVFLMLITKESTGLWLFFILIGMLFKYTERDKKDKLILIILSGVSLIYFLAVVELIMPSISHNYSTFQFERYSKYGNSALSIFYNLISNPLEIVNILFNGNSDMESQIKRELHYAVLLSGGFAFVFRPYYLIYLIPIYAFKFLTDNINFYGIAGQYSIEFVPIISFALCDWLNNYKRKSLVLILGIISVVSTLCMTYHLIEDSKIWMDRVKIKFYEAEHYKEKFNIDEIQSELDKVPDKEIICVNSFLAPHLSNREKIYMFPYIRDAKYVIILKSLEDTYPITREEFKYYLNDLYGDTSFLKLSENSSIVLFKKN